MILEIKQGIVRMFIIHFLAKLRRNFIQKFSSPLFFSPKTHSPQTTSFPYPQKNPSQNQYPIFHKNLYLKYLTIYSKLNIYPIPYYSSNKYSIQMYRSSSLASISQIKFDPKQIKTGSSSIDKLPIRRVASSKNLQKSERCGTSKQSGKNSQYQRKNSLNKEAEITALQYNIDLLTRMNESLERQNIYLKKQLQFYNTKNPKQNPMTEPQKKDKYKQKLLMRINNKVNDVSGKRLSSEDFTIETTGYGLISSKMCTPKKTAEQSIKQQYERYENQGKLPDLQNLRELVHNYFQSIRDNYYKLKIIIQKTKTDGKSKEQHKKLSETISLLEMPILYRKNPKIIKKLFKQFNNSNHNEPEPKKKQQFCLELCSPQEILILFESICKYLLKNPKLTQKLTSNLYFLRLIKKIKQ